MCRILGLMTCFNRKEKTLNAIRKLINGNPKIEFSFLITDDNSRDGTLEALNELPNVTCLKGTGSLFYSGGMRMAISSTFEICKEQYDFCLLFNDDVDFFDGAIEHLANLGNRCVWVGPTCDNNMHLTYGGVVKLSSYRPKFRIVMSQNDEGRSCDTFNANCVLIPWNIFKQLGNMDIAYSHSLGDFDYGFTAKRMGIDIRVTNYYVGVCIDNLVAGNWKDTTLNRKKRLQLKESPKGLPRKEWFYYLHKNYSLMTAVVYSIIPYLRIVLKK